MMRMLVVLLGMALAVPTLAQEDLPEPLQEIGFDQRLGETLPLDTRLVDESGRPVQLADFMGERPVVLAFVYYDCPMICNMVLNGLTHALRPLKFSAGEEFEVVVVSFDPTETPELAAAKKANYMREYSRPGTEGGWHFLTGSEDQVRALTAAGGFRYALDEETGEYAHATGILTLTPDGRIARLLYGIDYAPMDVKLALVEAGEGKIGSVVEKTLLLYCFRYDPTTGRYGAVVINMVRLAGIFTVGGILLFWFLHWRRGRRPDLAGGVA